MPSFIAPPHSFGQEEHAFLVERAENFCKIHVQPRFLLTELLRILDAESITIPAYSTFQKIISQAINNEQKRLRKYIQKKLPEDIQLSLDDLLKGEGSFYRLTALKKRAKDFRLNQIREEIEKHAHMEALYTFSRSFLPHLNLSNENIRYYASLAEYYPVNRLQNMPKEQARLYLLCFIFHCYEQVSDNLIVDFIHQVSSITQDATQASKKQISEYHLEHRKRLYHMGKIGMLFVDETIDGKLPFDDIKQHAFGFIDPQSIKKTSRYLMGENLHPLHYEWSYIQEVSRVIALNIRPLIMAIQFKSTLENDPLINALGELKSIYLSGKTPASQWPLNALEKILPKKIKPWITHPSHGEFFIYQQLKKGLDAGDIFYSGSTRYKSFDEDLISKKGLEEQKSIIDALEFPLLHTPMKKRLSDLKTELEEMYRIVNERILNGENKHLKLTKKKGEIHWTLPYKKQADQVNNPFYEQLPQVDIVNVLQYVNEKCNFMEAFKHIQPRYAKNKAEWANIVACIMAYGERIGLSKMAGISDTKHHRLDQASKNYMRLENTRKANDIISNAIAKLPIFPHYNLDIGTLHASADGQKFESQRNTFKARYSPKYFGRKKGLVNFSLIANHVPVNAKLLGANEHESHYGFDIVFNNTSEIDPDIISVDMAGTNQVNFVLLETFGRKWAPRYTHINRKSTKLLGFHPPGKYPEEYLIKPSRIINEELILSEEENIQRIFASLALKTTTQSTIVRKLSSYARQNRTKKALWELDSIYMSLHILKFIDDPIYRRNVYRALNRGESYNQLHRAIPQPGGGKFKGTTDYEIALENDCTRLIANTIIFYNMSMLSKIMHRLKIEGREEEIALLKRLSPVAWRHINLFGKYKFNGDISSPDLDEIIKNIRLNFG